MILAVAFAMALTSSSGGNHASRRAIIAGGIKAGLLSSAAVHAANPPEECLSCKLKQSISDTSDGDSKLEVGDTIDFTKISSPKKLAVTDVIDIGRDPSRFEETMTSTLQKYDPEKVRMLLWVQSELVGPQRIPWCPDTRAALPLLERALYNASGEKPIVLVTADVVRDDYYRPDYPYRRDAKLQLTGVPTLYRWGRDGPIKRLQERQITASALDALIA